MRDLRRDPITGEWIFVDNDGYEHVLNIPAAAAPPAPSPQFEPQQPSSADIGTKIAILGGVLIGGLFLYGRHKKRQRSEDVTFGFDSELDLADDFYAAGAKSVEISPGSRGAVDIYVKWKQKRQPWAVQLKSSRRGRAKTPSPDERIKLIAASKKAKAVPIVAQRDGDGDRFRHAATGEDLPLRQRKR